MRLGILGTRGKTKVSVRRHLKHSGILIDERVLLDIGEKEYLDYRPKWIFITHLHSDHMALNAGDIPQSLPVYAPEASRLLPSIHIVSKPVAVGSFTITPVPTVHSQRVKSVGYIVQKGAERIFYSSDMISIERKYHRLLRNLDLVITEGSFM